MCNRSDLPEYVAAYRSAVAAEKAAKAAKEAARDAITAFLDSEGVDEVSGDGFRVVQSLRETMRFDQKAAAAAGLDLDPFKRSSVSVVFNIYNG